MRFIDQVTIEVHAGQGGPGCVSFRREPYVPQGGPNGGDGGDGGSVILVGDANVGTLLDLHYQRSYKAQRGRPGQGSQKTGARGRDVRIAVPLGTEVYEEENETLIGDVVVNGQELVVARGGQGGRGNVRFKSATDQAPRKADVGRPGESNRLRLELKLLADVGLVGFPNAGKSTLLSTLTAARPKVADYPFTTLVPNLGILDLGDYRSCVIADIPGLIEGASEGRGLGHAFLRHVERTRLLVFLLDVWEDPADCYATLRRELERHGEHLSLARRIVCLSKMDSWPQGEEPPAVAGVDGILQISSVTGQGLDELRRRIRRELEEAKSSDEMQDSSGGES
jgi:GTP-binding protein